MLTTEELDATRVQPLPACLGDAEAERERDCTEAHGAGHVEDGDGDGGVDLLLHYGVAETGIGPTDTTACLHGETCAGARIYGCDAITVTGRRA